MSKPLFTNNAKSTLAGDILIGATTLTVATGEGSKFPSPNAQEFFALTLQDPQNEATLEIVYCTARSGDVLTVTRAQEGTSARAWAEKSLAELRLTAGVLELVRRPDDFFELDENGDAMPSLYPVVSSTFDLDGNGDLQPI